MNDKSFTTEKFPANSWVNIRIGQRRYMGRAICNERAHIVSTVDDSGKSVTFSWPYICANAEEVHVLDMTQLIH